MRTRVTSQKNAKGTSKKKDMAIKRVINWVEEIMKINKCRANGI